MDGTEVSLHVNFNVFDAKKIFRSPYVTIWTEKYGQKNQSISCLHKYVPYLSVIAILSSNKKQKLPKHQLVPR